MAKSATQEKKPVVPPRGDADDGAAPPKQELAVVQQAPSLLQASGLSEAAAVFLGQAEGIAEAPASIPIIAINHKDACFTLPSGELVEEVSGYPIYWFATRRYYAKPPQPGAAGAPPDCWSADLLQPSAESAHKQADYCCNCDNAKFGSGRDGRSQACGQFTWVFLLNPDFGKPPVWCLVAPPSSIRALMGTKFKGGFFSQAKLRAGAYQLVWTTMRLEAEQGQVPFCRLAPEMGPIANKDEALQLVKLHNDFLGEFNRMRGLTPKMTAPAGDEE